MSPVAPALVSGDDYHDLAELAGDATLADPMEAILRPGLLSELSATLGDRVATGRLSADMAKVGPPVPRPQKSFAVGLNYQAHADEGKVDPPEVPLVFTKFPSCLVGPTADVHLRSDACDYEGELLVVIGTGGKDIAEADAWNHVVGMAVAQDISDRRMQFAAKPPHWDLGKSFDTFGPTGPVLVSLDELENRDSMQITTTVNGDARQDDTSANLIFDVPTLISYISRVTTLVPGDLIFTGTPEGVGAASRRFLADGDVITTTISGLGNHDQQVRACFGPVSRATQSADDRPSRSTPRKQAMAQGMITSADDLTPAWVTDLLRSTGDLDAAAEVAVVEVTPFGGAESMVSSLLRVAVTYEGPSEGPSSLIVKLASTNADMRFLAGMLQFYVREVRFYRELAASVDVTTPRCYLAEMYPDDQGFVVVLEEIAGCRGVDQIEGLSFADARKSVEMLADFHAPFWGKVKPDLARELLPFDDELLQQLIPAKNIDDWQKVRPMLADGFPPELIAIWDSFVETGPRIMDDLMGTPTVIHGDCRADNLLFEQDGSVVVLDFQLMTACNGMVDVSYLLCQSLRADAQERTPELIEAYLDRLASLGVDIDLDEAMRAYTAATIFFLGIPFNILANEGLHERSVTLGRTMVERAVREIVRTGAHLRYGGASSV